MTFSGTIADSSTKVLIITAYRWPTTTRLALALFEAGVAIEALCPVGHSLASVEFVSKVYRYHALRPLRSLSSAIAAAKPDLIIPTDDTAAALLHELYKRTHATESASVEIRSVIARSLGDPANYRMFYSRARFASLAHVTGVLSPQTTNIRDHVELVEQLEKIGFPAVLKVDGSFGGMGVAIVHTPSEAKQAFVRLSAYHSMARAFKRLIVDRDANLVLPCLRKTRPQLSIQRFLFGKPANAAVACWEGTVLAQVCVQVIASNEPTGPATIVRVIAHRVMSTAVERLVRALNLSGLCGFDFILDGDGSAHLIDFNPRATQTCHLLSSERMQPVQSLAAKLRGLPPIVHEHLNPHCGPIVLFPHGLVHKPQSQSSEYHNVDLPPKWPQLVEIGFDFHRQQDRFLARALRLAQGLVRR